MTVQPETIAFLQWLVNQGIGVAVALLVLWRIDTRLARVESRLDQLNNHLSALRHTGEQP